jgi:hypothetical protein
MRYTLVICMIGVLVLSVGLGLASAASKTATYFFAHPNATTVFALADAGVREVYLFVHDVADVALDVLHTVRQHVRLS